jgi:DNA-binding ferritin-like protein (Dps family)
MGWRFVHGRPVSQVTGDDLAGVAQRLVPDGKKAWRLI